MATDFAGLVGQALLANQSDATLLTDLCGTVLFANAAARRQFSLPEDADEDRRLEGWADPLRSLPQLLRDVAGSSNWVPVLLKREGDSIHMQARGVLVDAGKQPCVLFIAVPNATKPFMRQMDQIKLLNHQLVRLQQTQRRLDFALRAAEIGIWELNLETQVAWRSERHDQIFGYDHLLPEWTFEQFMAHVLEEDRAQVRTSFQANTEAGKPWRFQCRIRRADGEIRWISAEGAPTLDEAGDVRLLSGIVADITEQKNAEHHLLSLQRMEALGRMAGGLAHDFANIIGVIRLSADVASLSSDLASVRDRLKAVIEATKRGSDLTLRTLAFAKREPGVARSVALRPLVADLLMLPDVDLTRAVAIDFDVPEGIYVRCDPSQLEHALLNLLINARHAIATAEKGELIRIEAARRPDQGLVEVSVSDDGPGMAPDVVERAADPFFTTKTGSGGTGLGLATVAHFVMSAGGTLDITSREGEGTRVAFTLPETPAIPESGHCEGDATAPAVRLRILIVDDSAEYREVLELALAELGHTVIAASNSTEALEVLGTDTGIDVMMTDILMPDGLNGFELAKAAGELSPSLPIIYMSGYADDAVDSDAQLGVFLRKPATLADIQSALEQVVSGPN